MAQFTRYPANTALRDKMGTIKIPAAQMAVSMIDVLPIVNENLRALDDLVSQTATVTYGREDFLSPITKHVMDIKSITGMSGHMATSKPASVMLDFLETTGRLDNTVLDIIRAFAKITTLTLDPSIDKYDAQKHLNALTEACKRYRDKSEKIINA